MRLLLFVLLVGFSGSALARDCFPAHSIQNWKYIGRDTIQIKASARRIYEVTTFSCFGLRSADRLGFRTWPSGAFNVCKGDDILIMDNFDNRVDEICPIRNIVKL